MELLLLPGMDGTGKLFAPFLAHLPPHLLPRVISYPSDQVLTYDQLLERIEIPDGQFAIVAESFAGPLGIQLAARSGHARALVLIASFAHKPARLPALLCQVLCRPWLFRIGSPDFALRFLLLGQQAANAEIAEVRTVLRSVRPEVLAGRLQEIFAVDVRAKFAHNQVPTIYIAGSQDRLVGPKTVKELKALRPDMKTVFLDSPHLVLQRKPAEAARIVTDFLRESALANQ